MTVEDIIYLSPAHVPFLPGWWPSPGQYPISRFFIRRAAQRLGMTSPVLWMQDPRDLYFVDAVKPRLLCYDCMDDYALIAPSPETRPRLRAQELLLLKQADVVFAASRDLAQRCAETNPNVVLVPNGVDAATFAPDASDKGPGDRPCQPQCS